MSQVSGRRPEGTSYAEPSLQRVGIVREDIAHAWIVEEELWELAIEFQIVANDDGERSAHSFRYILR